MRITFVRHGETEWNRIGRIQGVTDVPLNDTGRKQAARSAEMLMQETWTTITSSPLKRARETAQIIADTLGQELGPALDLLREQDYGEAEGVSTAEFRSRWPNRDWKGGESAQMVQQRALQALQYLEKLDPDGDVLAVCHRGFIRHLVAALTGLDRDAVPVTANAALTTLEKEDSGTWRVTVINNQPAHHLLPALGAQAGPDRK